MTHRIAEKGEKGTAEAFNHAAQRELILPDFTEKCLECLTGLVTRDVEARKNDIGIFPEFSLIFRHSRLEVRHVVHHELAEHENEQQYQAHHQDYA